MQGSIGNSPRFNECTPWPVQGWDMLLAARNNLQHVQTIVPRRVWVRKTDGDVVPFKYLCWFCCRARLSRDLLFVDDNDDAEEGV